MNPKRKEALYIAAMVALTVAVLVSAAYWIPGVIIFGVPLGVGYVVVAHIQGWTQ